MFSGGIERYQWHEMGNGVIESKDVNGKHADQLTIPKFSYISRINSNIKI